MKFNHMNKNTCDIGTLASNLDKEVEKKDHIRNFQPPINGIEIMKLFNISEGKDKYLTA